MNGYSIMYININNLSLNSKHCYHDESHTYDWFYKALISVKVFLNNLTSLQKKKRIMYLYFGREVLCGIYASATAPSTLNSQTKWNKPILSHSPPTHWVTLAQYIKINITLFYQYSTYKI